MTALPNDLLSFLRLGRQLEYDEPNSEIGRLMLKSEMDLSLSTITTFPNYQSIINDPYSDLDGLYQIEVYDLVAESERYDKEGLLCWIVAVKRFGSVDPEHGDVLTFPDATWTDLAKAPLPYLDAQWNDGIGERVLPWLYFQFKLRKTETVLRPYGAHCPVHGISLAVQRVPRLPLLDSLRRSVLRRREKDDWLQNHLTTFPCSGLPVNEDELLCCPECRAAESQWANQVEHAIIPLEARPNAHGWIQCPGCGIRFSTTDAGEFNDGVHLSCGQKISLVT
jgi:hypothetical protein